MAKRNMNKKVSFFTLGCKLNFTETSTLARRFAEKGYLKVNDKENPDIVIVNTCSVTQQADRKSRQYIRKMSRRNPDAVIIVTGCYAQLQAEEIAKNEHVDYIFGSNEKLKMLEIIPEPGKQAQTQIHTCPFNEIDLFSPAYSANDRTRAFLKVQDGCDYFCAYCTVPFARGKSRSGEIDHLCSQAEKLGAEGNREIVITGINIGDFGKNTDHDLLDLIKALDEVHTVDRFRISSVEPELLSEQLISFILNSKRIMPHFHVPLQSGCNKLLKNMKRRYDTGIFRSRLDTIRSLSDEAGIGVDVIVGLPGETDEDFLQTYNFLNQADISYLHVFSYSKRENTLAARMKEQVAEKTITERSRKLQNLSARKSKNFLEKNINSKVKVLFEDKLSDNTFFGYTENYIRVAGNCNQEVQGRIFEGILTDPEGSNGASISEMREIIKNNNDEL